MRAWLTPGLLIALVALAGCGSGGAVGPPPGGDDPLPPSIAWGPRLDGSGLSALAGAEDEFRDTGIDAVARAARSAPNGASQSSLAEDGRTAGEFSVRVVYDEDVGNLVHEITDNGRIVVRVPFIAPRQGFELAAFTDLIPGIEPDLSSYPHEVLGVWAWDGEAGAFWSMSPSIPAVRFDRTSPTGTATYEGDAAGLHTANGTTTRFLADVRLAADFGDRTVGGTVNRFRSLTGAPLGGLSVTLGATGFAADGAPFAGETASGKVSGGGRWGGRWSDGKGWTMGGTFGFAADDSSIAVLGAFTACSCASASGGRMTLRGAPVIGAERQLEPGRRSLGSDPR